MKIPVYFLTVLTVCFLCMGCKTKFVNVPVETIRSEKEYIDRWLRDSIHIQDSIFLTQKGDTVFLEKYKTVYKDRIVRDSVVIVDSVKIEIPYPVEVIKEVKAPYAWYEKLLFALGIACIAIAGFNMYRWFKK